MERLTINGVEDGKHSCKKSGCKLKLTSDKCCFAGCVQFQKVQNKLSAYEDTGLEPDDIKKLISEYRTCAWEQEDYNGSTWGCSDCGAEWTLEADNPFENGMRYCPECGAQITEIVFRQYDITTGEDEMREITRKEYEATHENITA